MVLQLKNTNIDSILDLGLTKFVHREKFRLFAKANGNDLKFHFLDILKEIRKQRILNRNVTKGVTYEFDVTKETFKFMEGWFEKPTDNGLKNAIIIA